MGPPRTTLQNRPRRVRAVWLVLGAVIWLLLASEISDEENAHALAQALGIAAWALLGGSILGWLLLWLVRFTITVGRRLISFTKARRIR
jgi:membrane associated rhomboid family serine protease